MINEVSETQKTNVHCHAVSPMEAQTDAGQRRTTGLGQRGPSLLQFGCDVQKGS